MGTLPVYCSTTVSQSRVRLMTTGRLDLSDTDLDVISATRVLMARGSPRAADTPRGIPSYVQDGMLLNLGKLASTGNALAIIRQAEAESGIALDDALQPSIPCGIITSDNSHLVAFIPGVSNDGTPALPMSCLPACLHTCLPACLHSDPVFQSLLHVGVQVRPDLPQSRERV